MSVCKHQRILQTNHGKFCYDCGMAQGKPPGTKKTKAFPQANDGIARIWER